MLHTADSLVANDCPDTFELTSLKRGLKPGNIRPEPAPIPVGEANAGSTTSRYGEHRGFNVSALGLTISLHVLAVALLLGVRHHVVQHEEVRLVSINLTPPPPAPAEPASQPTPKNPAVSAPRPLLQINPQQANIPVAVDPEPAPPSAEPVKVSMGASPSSPAAASVIQGGDLGTRMVAGKPPRYPLESRRRKEQGTVLLSLILGLDGAVEHISVSRSSGSSRLDSAALNAVRKWRWEPVVRGGQPVKVRGIVEIPFVLKG